MVRKIFAVGVVALGLVGLGACGNGSSTSSTVTTAPVIDPGDGGRYAPRLDPAAFVDQVDNPSFPLPDGASWTYEGSDRGTDERIEVRVLPERREVMGIPAVVVRDTVTTGGEVTEDTFDWYAQDTDGNVWYLGEETKEYDHGQVVSTAGSWEAGVGGAYPGIVMRAAPKAGDAYRQEYLAGEAEDLAAVVEVGARERVAAGAFSDLVVIREWNPLAPKVVEEKYYASGVGPVLEVVTRGGHGRVELVASTLAGTGG